MTYHKFRAGERRGTYIADAPLTEDDILTMAKQLARRRLAKGRSIGCSTSAARYLRTIMQGYEREVFAVVFLDTRHRVIAFEELFQGTVDAAAVYPREVVKRALELSATAVLLTHNHPSGAPDPSEFDRLITRRLSQALGLIDIRVLDHMVVGTEGSVSLAERGWL